MGVELVVTAVWSGATDKHVLKRRRGGARVQNGS